MASDAAEDFAGTTRGPLSSAAAQIDRLRLMADDTRGRKWDLSPSDRAAIRAALWRLDDMERQVRFFGRIDTGSLGGGATV